MLIRQANSMYMPRLYVLMGLMVGAFFLLGMALWRLQVAHVSQFEDRQNIQSLRRVRLPGIRGKIYDRNGLCLADNRPVYSIVLYLEDVRRAGPWSRTIDGAMKVIQHVSDVTGLPPMVDREAVKKHIHYSLPIPLVLWSDVDPHVISRLAEMGSDIPGVDIYVQPSRIYPFSPDTSHLLGYVGRTDITKLNEEERYSYYLPEMTGKSGLEKHFDPFLRGTAGGTLVQIDVAGYRHGELARKAPTSGGDLRLTLDMDIQRLAGQALGRYRGAVVVLDPNNGDVLAMLSRPGYDANRMVPFIPSELWASLSENPEKPFLNRAVAGIYPPGSIFKPLVGLAAAGVNPESLRTIYDSPATFQIGGRTVRTTGYGEVDLREALKFSANVYFFKTALNCGPEVILQQASAVGLGKKTGVEVDYEVDGLVPELSGWSDGDTCNLAIGQGALSVTPIQMAMMTATIANGGYLYRPRLVQAYRASEDSAFMLNEGNRIGKMNWSQSALQVVRGGMRDVIMDLDGTGHRAAVEGLEFAGKTGTAEYGVKGEGSKHTWMIAFAPFERPQYAVAILIENGDSGGLTVGPCMKRLMEGLFEKMKREKRLSGAVVPERRTVGQRRAA